jgi:hypothetical protein
MLCPVYFTGLLSSPPTLSLFSGSAVVVYGTTGTTAYGTTGTTGIQDPTWECSIDNASISWASAELGSQNNLRVRATAQRGMNESLMLSFFLYLELKLFNHK